MDDLNACGRWSNVLRSFPIGKVCVKKTLEEKFEGFSKARERSCSVKT